MKFVNPIVVDAFLNVIGGGFFTVTFLKKNGESRVMRCRKGVKKHLKGGESTIKANLDLVGVYDIATEDYRCFDKNKVIEIKGAGMCLMTNGVEIVSG